MDSKTPGQQNVPTFSTSAKSYKRRSLQSPFILHDLASDQERDDTSFSLNNHTSTNNSDDEEFILQPSINGHRRPKNRQPQNDAFIQPSFPDLDALYTPSLSSPSASPQKHHDSTQFNNIEFPSSMKTSKTNRYSLQSINTPSINAAAKKHRRSTSTASANYTPAPLTLPPVRPLSGPNTPPVLNSPSKNNSPKVQPFGFSSLIMNNNSSENLSIPSSSAAMKEPQVLPKANYRRGHRYKHSSVSMNMFQDPQRVASMSKPHNLPQKYTIPTVREVLSMILPSQKKKILACLIQSLFVLLAYIAGFHYLNLCLSTLAHILFYDVISNLSSVLVQIMSNFEVWRLSSLQYPFGLGRIEVLFGFALSVSLLFVGLDLFSHILEELLINSLSNNSLESSQSAHSHSSSHSHSDVDKLSQLHPVIYEVFILLVIFIIILTSHIVNDTSTLNNTSTEKKISEESTMAPNVKRLSSITLKEPARENVSHRVSNFVKSKIGIKPNLFYSSTTGISLLYAVYSLYYPFAQGILKLHSVALVLKNIGLFSDAEHDTSNRNGDALAQEQGTPDHTHIGDAIKATEWINQCSTVALAFLVSFVAWRLIWRLGNILLLASPSIDMCRNSNLDDMEGNNTSDVEHLIRANVKQLDVYKNSYSIDELKVARLNTRIYVVIVRVHMPGASDDDEAKFRFYTMRIIRAVMYQAVKGQLKRRDNKSDKRKILGRDNHFGTAADNDQERIEEENRRSLIDLLNLSTSIEDVEGIDSSGDQFEITVDINRL